MSIPATVNTQQLIQAIKQEWYIRSDFEIPKKSSLEIFFASEETQKGWKLTAQAIEYANQALHSLRVTESLVQSDPRCEPSQRKFQVAVLTEYLKEIHRLIHDDVDSLTDPLYYSRAYCSLILGNLSQAAKDIEMVVSTAPIYLVFRVYCQTLQIESSLSPLERKAHLLLAKTKNILTRELLWSAIALQEWSEAEMDELWNSHAILCKKLLIRFRELLARSSVHQFNPEKPGCEFSALEKKILLLAACKPAADAGNPIAQFALGYCYKEGIGREIDAKKCCELWWKSACQKEALALFALGKLIFHKGCPDNIEKESPFNFFFLAAERNDPRSIMTLGLCYAKGIDVELNENKAVHYLKIAAERGCSEAQQHLEELIKVL